MDNTYTLVSDLGAQEIPSDGILSRTLYDDERVKAVVFAFGKGQELSEHTASMPAIVQIVKGEARVTLGTDAIEATAGTWAHMPAQLPHSVQARTPLIMLLLLLKRPGSAG
ncbi:MAG: cupin domain-containing protein [Candidatus Binatia bacterium]